MSNRIESDGCFVCGTGNPIGLKLTFRMEGDVCRSEFTSRDEHAGYPGVTHGGIVFSLLDDVMANWLWLQDIQGMTAKAEVRYRGELPIGVPVRLEGRCVSRRGRLAQMHGQIIREDDGLVVAEATASFMTRG
ncbi:MAG: PaaI family thioesterase [Pseudomonadales bacterium]